MLIDAYEVTTTDPRDPSRRLRTLFTSVFQGREEFLLVADPFAGEVRIPVKHFTRFLVRLAAEAAEAADIEGPPGQDAPPEPANDDDPETLSPEVHS